MTSFSGSFRRVLTATGFLVAALVIFQIQFANMVRQPVFVLFIEELYGSGESVARFVGRLMFVAGLVAQWLLLDVVAKATAAT